MGNYVKTFQQNGIHAMGFDGNPNTPELTSNVCKVLDLSVPNQFDTPFDWVMSLEVGEHLPKQFEDVFVQNLHNNNKYGIVLSWAIKGQGGHGHFNEQNNDYIKSKLYELGYINDVESERALRKNSTFNWFKNTIMVFRKIYYYRQDNYNLCLVHNKPEHLNNHIINLPNIYNIGSYTRDYRKYFENSEKTNFMIDIGANMGLSACPVLSLGYKVVCFEPELLNIEILQRIKEKNNYENMFIENYAVIGERGKKKTTFYSNIHREDNSSIHKICSGKNVNPVGILEKEVNSITLDEWFESNKNKFNLCDLLLIKMDVQGGELEILKGASQLLQQCSIYGKCQVEIECDDGFMKELNISFDTINNIMDSYGYVCKQKGYDSIFVPKKT
jgi:FkbM family methyltransferase